MRTLAGLARGIVLCFNICSCATLHSAGVGAGHVSSVSCVAFARRGGKFLASGGADKLLKVRHNKVKTEINKMRQLRSPVEF